MKNQNEVFTFQFSESENQVRSLLMDDKPFFVGNDVAVTLGYKAPKDAIRQHCKGAVKHRLLTKGGMQSMNVIPEGDVFRLIIHSELPSAEKFERWVMEEVLPSLRKTGKYQMHTSKRGDFVDLRHEMYSYFELNNKKIRFINYNGQDLFSLIDRNKAMGISTGVNQQVKTLGQNLAFKIWIYGNTNPSWFVTKKALELLELGKRNIPTISPNQLRMFN